MITSRCRLHIVMDYAGTNIYAFTFITYSKIQYFSFEVRCYYFEIWHGSILPVGQYNVTLSPDTDMLSHGLTLSRDVNLPHGLNFQLWLTMMLVFTSQRLIICLICWKQVFNKLICRYRYLQKSFEEETSKVCLFYLFIWFASLPRIYYILSGLNEYIVLYNINVWTCDSRWSI